MPNFMQLSYLYIHPTHIKKPIHNIGLMGVFSGPPVSSLPFLLVRHRNSFNTHVTEVAESKRMVEINYTVTYTFARFSSVFSGQSRS